MYYDLSLLSACVHAIRDRRLGSTWIYAVTNKVGGTRHHLREPARNDMRTLSCGPVVTLERVSQFLS